MLGVLFLPYQIVLHWASCDYKTSLRYGRGDSWIARNASYTANLGFKCYATGAVRFVQYYITALLHGIPDCVHPSASGASILRTEWELPMLSDCKSRLVFSLFAPFRAVLSKPFLFRWFALTYSNICSIMQNTNKIKSTPWCIDCRHFGMKRGDI